MQNTFHSEPTEKDNPYASNPYSIPPPPPKKSIGHVINIAFIASLILLSGIFAMLYVTKPETSTGSAIVYVTPEPPGTGLGAQSHIPTPAPDPPIPTAPPPTPTVPPIPSSAPYSSDQIYDDLVQAGLADNGGSHDFSPFDFRGSTIRPEGGMIDFQDLSTRSNMNIATFASTLEVQYYIDDYNGAFSVVASVHNCVLQVQNAANSLPPNLTPKYKSVLETYCT